MSGRVGLNSSTAKSQSHSFDFHCPGMVMVSNTALPYGAVGAEVFAPQVTLPVEIHPFW